MRAIGCMLSLRSSLLISDLCIIVKIFEIHRLDLFLAGETRATESRQWEQALKRRNYWCTSSEIHQGVMVYTVLQHTSLLWCIRVIQYTSPL